MPIAKSMYCSKCRDTYGHHIASGKVGSDIYRHIAVIKMIDENSYLCQCEKCGREWKSTASESADFYKAKTRS